LNTTTPAKLAAIVAPLRDEPRESAILCDVDGTLAPIVADPADARVPDSTREALRAVARRFALVACVTGRPALEARMIVGIEEITYAGNHGFELLEPGSSAVELDPSVAGIAHAAGEFVGGLPALELAELGLRIEDKGPIQAIHWRGAPDEDAAQARAVEIALEASGAGLVPKPGRKVLELRPAAGVDKGTVAVGLIAGSGASRALFGGDDVTDLDAFRALRERREAARLDDAVCVGVASEEAPPALWDESDAIVAGTEGFAWVLRMLGGAVERPAPG
jgi:trehalose 6-phosphate phosphatase